MYFHTYCEIICSSSLKNTVGNLMGIALNLWTALGSILNCTKAFQPQGLFWPEITSPCPPNAASVFQGSAPSPLLAPPLLPAPDSGFPSCSLPSRPAPSPQPCTFQSATTLFVHCPVFMFPQQNVSPTRAPSRSHHRQPPVWAEHLTHSRYSASVAHVLSPILCLEVNIESKSNSCIFLIKTQEVETVILIVVSVQFS